MKFAYDSHIGKIRQVNQDRACVLKNEAGEVFAIVCDGMGGHLAGELAASMAIENMCQSFLEASPIRTEQDALTWINKAVNETNAIINEDAKNNRLHQGMGTTIVCCLVLREVIVIAHVGDSRAYLFENGKLIQLTKDHTYVNLLVDSGSITKEQAKTHPKKNILMKALGVFDEVVVSTMVLENKQQFFMLCSDGLYNSIDEEELILILNEPKILEEKILQLIQRANENGGPDNISVILIDGGEISE